MNATFLKVILKIILKIRHQRSTGLIRNRVCKTLKPIVCKGDDVINFTSGTEDEVIYLPGQIRWIAVGSTYLR